MWGPVVEGRAGSLDGTASVIAFDLDRFIGDCCTALSMDPPHKAVREVVARAVPRGVLLGPGEIPPVRLHLRRPGQEHGEVAIRKVGVVRQRLGPCGVDAECGTRRLEVNRDAPKFKSFISRTGSRSSM